jgi:NarL family two-component system response regulator LiaR
MASQKTIPLLITKKPQETLTPREIEIVRAYSAGYTKREVGQMFNISFHTVITHIGRVYEKTGVENKVQLVLWAVRNGLVTLE